jgi:hypothetical protein
MPSKFIGPTATQCSVSNTDMKTKDGVFNGETNQRFGLRKFELVGQSDANYMLK